MTVAKKLRRDLLAAFRINTEKGTVRVRVRRHNSCGVVGSDPTYDNGNGYRRVAFHGRHLYVHRVIWLVKTGTLPRLIDHRNGNTSDNRFKNLRRATKGQNAMNGKTPSNNTSGHRGVNWYKRDENWKATIKIRQRNIHLGYFSRKRDAIVARQRAERIYFGKFSRGRRT